MTTPERFIEGAGIANGRPPNDRQADCIRHDPATPLMIVAGPGTGKTTVLVLRALRHVFVDQILPEQILITTFTKKAAREIVTRLIEVGSVLLDAAKDDPTTEDDYRAFLDRVDINRFVAGSLDSVCQDAVGEARTVNERPPVVVEPFAANQWLSRYGDIWNKKEGDPNLAVFLGQYVFGDAPETLGEITAAVRLFVDRFVQDRVDLAAFQQAPNLAQKQALVGIFRGYRAGLAADNRLDFPALEERVLQVVAAGSAPPMLAQLRAILVDEYQDTNPLQEALYFELQRATGSNLTVVGDDDQSLYRFRGATMELFRSFAGRCEAVCGTQVRTLYLVENYRSVPEVVKFFNDFVAVDPAFAAARVQPPKPRIAEQRLSQNLPILGMFRMTPEALAAELGSFLHDIFRADGWSDPNDPSIRIERDREKGDFGDAVFLAHSVNEFDNADRYNPNVAPNPLLPMLLRRQLDARGVNVFNPGGQKLADVASVARLLGLVLESVDRGVSEDADGPLTGEARRAFRRWRAAGRDFIASNPRTSRNEALAPRIDRWRSVVANGRDPRLPNVTEWPALDVFYSFLPWMLQFQDDPEHQIYLEAISRCAAVAGTFSTFGANIVARDERRRQSVVRVLLDILQPIAQGLVQVDEDIMPSVPRDRLNIMTIHQAKGLEFPLVIVNVGMYATNHRANRFRRFPEVASETTMLEDHLVRCTDIGAARMERSALDRSFDDLVRLYYVAYSRPRSVLLLVGHGRSLDYRGAPPNIATWWRRDGSWDWREPTLANRIFPRKERGLAVPTIADNRPFHLIENVP